MFDELHRTLRETSDLLASDDYTSAESLEVRTRQLARIFQADDSTQALRILTCRIGTERYGWPVGNVRAIARLGKLTPVPNTPAFYRGVTNLRGQVLSVMDLQVYFGMAASTPPDLLIVIGGAQLEIGVLADDVFDVATINPAELTGVGLEPELIRGTTGEGLSILDGDGLLAREWRRIHEESR